MERHDATPDEAQGRGGAVLWLATGSWFGLSPIAPGTVGSIWGIPLAWAIWQIPFVSLRVILIVALCLVGIPLCTAAARRIGRKDPGAVVFDEIVSMPMTFFLIEMNSVVVVLVGFLLNRVFDISKPPPARRLERLPDGLGIMADDWVAGVYSNLVLQALVWSGFFARWTI